MKRTGLAALAVPTSVLVATVWLAIACSGATTSTPTPAQPSNAAVNTIAPSAPMSTDLPIYSPPIDTGPIGSQDPNMPPAGLLSAGGAPVQGAYGSYCWTVAGSSTCADMPPLTDSGPDLPLVSLATASTQLQFSLTDDQPFASWAASYVDDNGNYVPLGGAGSSLDPDAVNASPANTATHATFKAPPANDQWVVQVIVHFADGGDASYGWNVDVP